MGFCPYANRGDVYQPLTCFARWWGMDGSDHNISRQAEALAMLRLIRSRRVGPVTWHRLVADHGSAMAALAALPGIASAAGVDS